jgi:uncharacterized cofD-like protein
VASVAGALNGAGFDLTAVVSIADDGGSSGALRRLWGGPAVGDMRRSFIALSGDHEVLARGFARQLSLKPFGVHPVGNLVLRSIADAFGDLQEASDWLAEQLGVPGRILPATTEPVSLLAEAGDMVVRGECEIGAGRVRISRVRFDPELPHSPPAAIEAITDADWVLLGPGSLFTSVLAVCALPDVRSALARSAAKVLWITNLEADGGETAGMTAAEHLATLRHHGVRLDAVLHDPEAPLHLTIPELAGEHELEVFSHPLQGPDPGVHDRALLRTALEHRFAARGPLLDGHRLGEVARLIDVERSRAGQVIGEQL